MKTQESVYLYKAGDPKVSLKTANVRRRLIREQNSEEEGLQERRLDRYLLSQIVFSRALDSYTKDHLSKALNELSTFVDKGAHKKLATTLLLKANVSEYAAAVGELRSDWRTISIHSKECPNFKSTLKLIVNRFTENDPQVSADRRLTYDFNVLISWLRSLQMPCTRLLVIVEDTNSFDQEIINSLISHMHSYVESGQLPLHLVLNLAMPLPLFEVTITHKNEMSMETQLLLGSPSTPALVDHCAKALFDEPSLRLKLSRSLVERLASLELNDLITQLKYALLAHFAGNPLASIEDGHGLVSAKKSFAERLPSVHERLKADPDYLSKLNDADVVLADEIPEFQVGGNVLEMVFNPKYRPAIETALTDPRVFVSDGEVDRMSIPLCVLYQLSRESSIYINIYDFYSAFKTMVRTIPDCENWDTQSMAIFLESISALKMMGVLRDCKRKFECVEKVAWKGV